MFWIPAINFREAGYQLCSAHNKDMNDKDMYVETELDDTGYWFQQYQFDFGDTSHWFQANRLLIMWIPVIEFR